MAAIMGGNDQNPCAYSKAQDTYKRVLKADAIQIDLSRFMNKRTQLIMGCNEDVEHLIA